MLSDFVMLQSVYILKLCGNTFRIFCCCIVEVCNVTPSISIKTVIVCVV